MTSTISIADLFAPAFAEAQDGFAEGGIPIGSALFLEGTLIGRGRNQRVQQDDPILHAEMHCLQQAGRQPADVYRRSTLVTTLSPCDMCTGAILLYGIPRVVIGENQTFMGNEELLTSRGVKVIVLNDPAPRALMQQFIAREPRLWNEDIGE
jgi:creatinine deaminase